MCSISSWLIMALDSSSGRADGAVSHGHPRASSTPGVRTPRGVGGCHAMPCHRNQERTMTSHTVPHRVRRHRPLRRTNLPDDTVGGRGRAQHRHACGTHSDQCGGALDEAVSGRCCAISTVLAVPGVASEPLWTTRRTSSRTTDRTNTMAFWWPDVGVMLGTTSGGAGFIRPERCRPASDRPHRIGNRVHGRP